PGIIARTSVQIETRRVERRVGDAEAEILEESGLLQVESDLDGLAAGVEGDVTLYTPIQKLSRLALGSRRVVQQVRTSVIEELVLAHIRIEGPQHLRTEGVLVARSDAPGEHALPLVLCQLVEAIWNFQRVARAEQIQVERIPAVGLIIQPVEQRLIVAD